jgi:hypothetical protein
MAIHAVANLGQFFTARDLLRGKLPALPCRFEGYFRTPCVNGKGEREGTQAGDARQCTEPQSSHSSILTLIGAPSWNGVYATGYARRQLPRLNCR